MLSACLVSSADEQWLKLSAMTFSLHNNVFPSIFSSPPLLAALQYCSWPPILHLVPLTWGRRVNFYYHNTRSFDILLFGCLAFMRYAVLQDVLVCLVLLTRQNLVHVFSIMSKHCMHYVIMVQKGPPHPSFIFMFCLMNSFSVDF